MEWSVGARDLVWAVCKVNLVRAVGEIAGTVAEESVGAEGHCCLARGVGWAEDAGGDEAAYAYESSGFLVSFVSMLDWSSKGAHS